MPILEVTLQGGVLDQGKMGIYLRMAMQMSMRDIMDAADDHWRRLARQNLHQTQGAYVAGIQPVEIKGLTGTIALAGELPNMIEHGADEYNLQDVMLDGDQRVIAFRFATPGARGTDVGQRMTHVFAPKGPQSLSRTRRFKSLRQAQQLGKKVQALAFVGTVTDSKIRSMMPKVPHTKLSERHAVGAFEGMRREAGQGGRGQYKTFRTMTDERDKWIHPGFQPRNFMQQTAEYIEEIAPAAFQSYVEGLFP